MNELHVLPVKAWNVISKTGRKQYLTFFKDFRYFNLMSVDNYFYDIHK